MRQFRQGEGRERRFNGRLDDDRAARCKGGGCLPGDHGARKIPRRDRGADANRLHGDEQAAPRLVPGYRLAVGTLAFGGKPFDEADAIKNLGLGFGQRLALLGRQDDGKVMAMASDQLRPRQEYFSAIACEPVAPTAKGGIGGIDRPVHERRVTISYIRYDIAGCRISDCGNAAIRLPFAVDIGPFTQQLRIAETSEGLPCRHYRVQHIGPVPLLFERSLMEQARRFYDEAIA